MVLKPAGKLAVFHCDSLNGLHSTIKGAEVIRALYSRTLGKDCPTLVAAVRTQVRSQTDSWSCGYHVMANIQVSTLLCDHRKG